MYKLMVIDDEFWMRKYLRENINWKAYGIQMAGEAENAEEALEMLAGMAVDIIIVDINMPGLNGIEFSEIVIKRLNNVKVILISGYKEFEYARRALSLGVLDYILKPVDEEKLISVILRAVAELDDLKASSLKEEKTNQIAGIGLDLLKKKFYEDLLQKELESSNIVKNVNILQLDLQMGFKYMVLAMEIDNLFSIDVTDADIFAFKSRVMCLAGELLDKSGRKATIELEGALFAFILEICPFEEDMKIRERLTGVGETICGGVADLGKQTVTIGIGTVVDNFTRLHSSYISAYNLLAGKFYAGNNRVLTDLVYTGNRTKKVIFNKTVLDKIVESIRMSKKESIGEILSRLKALVSENSDAEPNYVRRAVIHFMDEILHQLTGTNQDNLFEDMDASPAIYKSETVNEIFSLMQEWVQAIINRLDQQKKNGTAKIVQDVLDIVKNRFHEDLFLGKVAEEVGVHPSYLCRIFKKETGENLIHYIMNYRVEKAKQFLYDNNVKIYEVAFMVGYENIKTFTRIFKNITGKTPKEYRERF
ncbi:MAG: response regulator [Ruminiclostridium sp.]|nr:response regulator [Ruminiclostridium sp.]